MANKVTIDENVCKGCGLCVIACPKKIVELDQAKINLKGYHPAFVRDIDICIACAMCAVMCPDSAIKIEKE